MIAETTAQQNKHNAALTVMQKSGAELDRIFQRMTRWVTHMLIIRQLREAWREAVSYAKEYYDALNEIRVVSGITEQEAAQLGDQYRAIAQEMNVTSSSIAKAAVSIFRQGYQGSDVQGVTKGAAVFGAITATDTDSALQTMTAALQNFKQDGESMEDLAFRIADSWSLLGDSVATTASDIGTAIGKVAGSATNVGLSLERTSAMAAVIMARTQESAEAVGTSLNSMISRYTKITEAGFNSIIEDEDGEMVKFNDIAKALSKVGIECYNAVDGFKSYDEVLTELGPKWSSLSEEMQNYISYQMSGSRNLNRFLTLMNNWDQVVELTADAMESGGTAMEKYDIWMESVAAAQNNLKNSMEGLYNTILTGDMMKAFYNGMAGFVDMFTQGTEAVNGLNLVLPVLAAGILMVTAALKRAGGAALAFKAAMTSHPIMMIISAAALAVTGITALASGISELSKATEKAIKRTSELASSMNESRAPIENISSTLSKLEGVSEPTAEQVGELQEAMAQLSAVPGLAGKFNADTVSIDNFTQSLVIANEALAEYMRQERYANFSNAHENIADAKKSYENAYDILSGGRGNYAGGGFLQQDPQIMTVLDSTISTVADANAKLGDLERLQERFTNEIKSYIYKEDGG